MKKVIQLSVGLVFFTMTLFAQETADIYEKMQTSEEQFIYLTNGELLTGKDYSYVDNGIFFKGKLSNAEFFYKNETQIDYADISFLFYEENCYGQVEDYTRRGISRGRTYSNTTFVTRGEVGYFDIYYLPMTYVSSSGVRKSKRHFYYSRNFDGIKLATYENLKTDMVFSDKPEYETANAEIMYLLEKGVKNKRMSPKLIVLGLVGFTIGGLMSSVGPQESGSSPWNNIQPTPEQERIRAIGGGLAIIGFTTTVVGVFKSSNVEKNMKALRKYNEVYFK